MEEMGDASLSAASPGATLPEVPVKLRLDHVTFELSADALASAGGMLAAMFSGRYYPGQTGADNAFIIDDRDPKMFVHIVSHLRGEKLLLDDLSDAGLKTLSDDCNYFSLDDLTAIVEEERTRRAQKAKQILDEHERIRERVGQLESEKRQLESDRKHMGPGGIVERHTARVGRRVAHVSDVQKPDADIGTITSTSEDGGTEVAVQWDSGRFRNNYSCGKRGRYDLVYASFNSR